MVAVVLGAAAANAEAVPCRVAEPTPVILTPATATIDETGGIVVANPPANAWELTQASIAQKLGLRSIAPGLVAIALPTNGMFELRDEKHVVIASATRGPVTTKPLPAPKPTAVKLAAAKQRGRDTTITALFTAKPPPSAVALIVYVKGKPRTWGRVTGATSVAVFRGSCQTTPPHGTVAPRLGETVTLVWLDETGHVSAASAAIKIR